MQVIHILELSNAADTQLYFFYLTLLICVQDEFLARFTKPGLMRPRQNYYVLHRRKNNFVFSKAKNHFQPRFIYIHFTFQFFQNWHPIFHVGPIDP